LRSKTKYNIFSGYGFFRTVACGFPTSNQKVLVYTTHTKKVIVKLYCYTLRSKIPEKRL